MILNVRWDEFVSISKLHGMANTPLIADCLSRISNNFYGQIRGREKAQNFVFLNSL